MSQPVEKIICDLNCVVNKINQQYDILRIINNTFFQTMVHMDKT